MPSLSIFLRGKRRCPCPCMCYAMLCYITLYCGTSISSSSSSGSNTSMRRRWGEATLPSLSSKEGGGDAHVYAMLYYTKRRGRRPLCLLSLFYRGRRRCPCPCLCYAIPCYITLYVNFLTSTVRRRGATLPSLF